MKQCEYLLVLALRHNELQQLPSTYHAEKSKATAIFFSSTYYGNSNPSALYMVI